jgi:WS/DGAT/MGAT family acyltransferase
MEHLSPLDAMFLDAEDADANTSMAIASVAIIDGPAPDQDEIVRTIAERLPLVPRYRQRVLRMPMDLSQPVWVDDPDFDIGYHVRRTGLPAPGDHAALCLLMGRLVSQRLDRGRPLWEYWVVEGLDNNRWAFISKVHHCMVDGMAGNELYRLIFDDPDAPGPTVRHDWHPAPLPTRAELTVEAFAELARTQVAGFERFAKAVLAPGVFQHRFAETMSGLTALGGSIIPVAPSSLIGPTGSHRRYGSASASLAEIVTVAKAFQVTVNDVVMTLVTGAFRTLLQGRGEPLDPQTIRAMVPVSVRPPEARSVLDNRVAMMLPVLPIEVADPVERLTVMHARMVALKASKEAEAGDAMNELARYEPFALLSASSRMAARSRQRSVVTVTTNVPGPRGQLSLLGHPVLEILPYVPISGPMRFGISVMTYHGRASFGVTGDYDSAPDVDVFATNIVSGLGDLLRAATQKSAPAPEVPAAGTATRTRSSANRKPARSLASVAAAESPPARRRGAAGRSAAATQAATPPTTAAPRQRRRGAQA